MEAKTPTVLTFKKLCLISLMGATSISTSLLYAGPAEAVVLTFDDVITGETTYSFDPDGDGIPDAVFSTTDPSGFRTIGPGTNQLYIDEPGLEGTSLLNPDLRVAFPSKAIGPITFGFALNSSATPFGSASFKLYDTADILLTSVVVDGVRFTLPGGGASTFPEGQLVASFAGEAAYGLFDFDTQFGRYIIDNLEGTFGSSERPPITASVPGPLPVIGAAAAFGFSRKLRKRIKSSKLPVDSAVD